MVCLVGVASGRRKSRVFVGWLSVFTAIEKKQTRKLAQETSSVLLMRNATPICFRVFL